MYLKTAIEEAVIWIGLERVAAGIAWEDRSQKSGVVMHQEGETLQSVLNPGACALQRWGHLGADLRPPSSNGQRCQLRLKICVTGFEVGEAVMLRVAHGSEFLGGEQAASG